jgi:hypothetical protein
MVFLFVKRFTLTWRCYIQFGVRRLDAALDFTRSHPNSPKRCPATALQRCSHGTRLNCKPQSHVWERSDGDYSVALVFSTAASD